MKPEGRARAAERQERSERFFSPANLISASRIPLAVVFAFVPDAAVRVAVVAAAAASDLLDGWIARRLGPSRLGAKIDPVADKLFYLTGFGVLGLSGALSPLEVAGVLLRDILTPLGYLASVLARRPYSSPARVGGKAVTVGQCLTLCAWLLDSTLLRPLAWATAAIGLYALADYGRLAVRGADGTHD